MLRVWVALLLLLPTSVFGFQDAASDTAPEAWQGEQWQITPLRANEAQLFYRAYQSSAPYLYRVLGWGWPTAKISTEMNMDMVRHHVRQHTARKSFTYVLRVVGERGIRGAIYVNPVNANRSDIPYFDHRDYDAEVSMWVTEEAEDTDAAQRLLAETLDWLMTQWDFEHVLLPVYEDYQFLQNQFTELELEPFTEDADASMLLYRYP